MRAALVVHALIAVGCGASHATVTPSSALAVGAACDPAKEAYACASDGTQMFVCDARHWRVAGKCAGAEHCVSTPSKIKCDDTLGEVGMPCAGEEDTACAIDGSALLKCTKGAMVTTSRCRGAKACVVVAGTPTCDRTTAEPGDPCDKDGEVACTVKRDAAVECRQGVMVQTTVCNCNVSGATIRCE